MNLRLSICFWLCFVFGQSAFTQNYYTTDFSSGITNVTVSHQTVSISNPSDLKVETANVGANYENIEIDFSAIDISSSPIVKISIKTNTTFDMRIDLIDDQGNSTNSQAVSKEVVSGAYSEFEYDFTGRFFQSYPSDADVDASNIVSAVIFFNAGGAGFSGEVNINEFGIGDDETVYVPTAEFVVNQVGYDYYGSKKALCSNCEVGQPFYVLNENEQQVYTGTIGQGSAVNDWGNTIWNTLSFSDFEETGTYKLEIGTEQSYSFQIQENALFELTSKGPIDFFNGMRSEVTADYNLSFNGSRSDQVNVYGGWWDANGDPGKHMSHLSFANHFNPQQIPMVVWSLLKTQEVSDFGTNDVALDSEVNWGVDYLIRNVDSDGYLYLAIFDDWGNNEASREICEWGAAGGEDSERSANYQAAMREGAGVAIAALAKASKMNYTNSAVALEKAELLYAHLTSQGSGYSTKNLEYCNNHEENIIDIYCGLLATVELYKATEKEVYKTDAKAYANRLMALQGLNGEVYSDENALNRPFYHAADEGLPIVALNEYLTIDNSLDTEIKAFATSWLNWFTTITYEVNNPFDYVRQYNKASVEGSLQTAKKSFFLPHENETDYWWQGENARLASMTTALLTANKIIDPTFLYGNNSASELAVSQLDWILGKNPFSICMMYGYGSETYLTYLNGEGNKLMNQPGGICNGITSDVTNELAPVFMPYDITDWQNWRWIEQWLPHDAWYLLAISKIDELNPVNNLDCADVPGGSAEEDACSVCSGGNTGIAVDECLITDLTNNLSSQLGVYPNPAENTVSISGEFDSWELFTITGNSIAFGQTKDVKVENLEVGLYILMVDDKSFKVMKK